MKNLLCVGVPHATAELSRTPTGAAADESETTTRLRGVAQNTAQNQFKRGTTTPFLFFSQFASHGARFPRPRHCHSPVTQAVCV